MTVAFFAIPSVILSLSKDQTGPRTATTPAKAN